MPIYEYYCASCDREFQVVRPISQSDEPAPCSECENDGQRQLSNFAFTSNSSTSPKFRASLDKPMRPHNKKPTA